MLNYKEIHKEKLPTIYLKSFTNAVRGYELVKTKSELFKIVYHGVKYMNTLDEKITDPNERFAMFEGVNAAIAFLTPHELMQIFPPTKKYDGEKWQCKDYFSTIEAMQKHGLNVPIGPDVYNFLWDYMNNTMLSYSVGYMSAMSALYKKETGVSLMEKFAEDNGIPVYHEYKAGNGREYMREGKTSKFIRIRKPLPDGLRFKRGGLYLKKAVGKQ